jgi:tetratricopeptide (TPR) repeat protein
MLKIVKHDDNLIKYAYDTGVEFARMGQFNEAILRFTELIKLNPENSEAYNCRAVCYFNIGRHVDAKYDFDSAVLRDESNDERNYMLSLNRAQLFVYEGLYNKAKIILEGAKSLAPDNLSILVNIGLIEKFQGDELGAFSDFSHAANLNVKEYYDKLLLAFALIQIEDFNGAIKAINKLDSKQITSLSATIKGDCYRLWGKNSDSELAYTKSLKILDDVSIRTIDKYLIFRRDKQGIEQVQNSFKIKVPKIENPGIIALSNKQINNFLRLYK